MLVEQEEIFDYIKDVEINLDRRFQGTDSKKLIFLVVDEFVALRISMARKNLMKSMIV